MKSIAEWTMKLNEICDDEWSEEKVKELIDTPISWFADELKYYDSIWHSILEEMYIEMNGISLVQVYTKVKYMEHFLQKKFPDFKF